MRLMHSLREAHAEGITDAELINRAMQAELDALSVTRQSEIFEIDEILAELAASGARLCFLALGAPKQEILAARGHGLLPQVGFVSIGAGLDFIAGAQVRAPVWVRRIAMEWAWRMLGNPRRLAKRYAQCALVLPGLMAQAKREAKGGR